MLAIVKAGIKLPVHYYGFLIDDQPEPGGFLDYARSHVHPDYVHRWSCGDLFLHGLRELKNDAKLARKPEMKAAWVDSKAKEECPRMYKPVGKTVVVLPLFSNTFPSYDNRPTQKQMDLITSLLKQKPRWWQAAPM
jgi:hypothetical protein